MLKIIEELMAFGSRGSTTRAERNAAQYLVKLLDKFTEDVILQPFSSPPTFAWALGLYCFLMLLSAVLIPTFPFLAAGLALITGIGYVLESQTYQCLSRILPKDRSQNIIARTSGGDGKTIPRVILVAHYDTARAGLESHPKLAENFQIISLAINISMAGIPFIALSNGVLALGGARLPVGITLLLIPLTLCLLCILFFLLFYEVRGKNLPGANDNASGVAVMVDAFESLSKDLPMGAEVWAVATGCNKVGAMGMLRFLEEYGDTVKDDYIINLDKLGIGKLYYVTEEGLLTTNSSHRDLIMATAAFCRQNPEVDITGYVHKSITDATPALVRGYKAMSIMAFPQDGFIRDEVELVDANNLELASKLTQAIAKEIWKR